MPKRMEAVGPYAESRTSPEYGRRSTSRNFVAAKNSVGDVVAVEGISVTDVTSI